MVLFSGREYFKVREVLYKESDLEGSEYCSRRLSSGDEEDTWLLSAVAGGVIHLKCTKTPFLGFALIEFSSRRSV